jgi:hypothetical protein
MLMKLKEGVNFTNMLLNSFLNESLLRNFSLIMFWLCKFCRKIFVAKAAHKMLMKLIKGVNLTNIL